VIIGLIDGGFDNIQNTSYCNYALQDFEKNIVSLSIAIGLGDVNNSVYFGAYMLRFFDPFAFHCYYATTESVDGFSEYLALNSAGDILQNLIYKTNPIFDAIRTIDKVFKV